MDRKPIKLLNWNARSVRAKKLELAIFLKEHDIDVATISETHLTPKDAFSIQGYSTVRLDRRSSSGGGVAILVRNSVTFSIIPHFNTTVIESLGVEVVTSVGHLKVIAVYCPRQCQDNNGTSQQFKNDLAKITRTTAKFVVGGDLNSRHELWGNHRRNRNGCLLFDHLQLGYYTIEYPDDPTYVSPAGIPSTLDFFLANQATTKPITINDLSSDHQPVVCEVSTEPAAAPLRQRKDYHRVNWVAFQRIVDGLIEEDPVIATTEDIDATLGVLQQAINTADEQCVRRVPVRGEYVSIDSHTKYLITLRNCCRRQFQRTGSLDKKFQMMALNKHIRERMEHIRNTRFASVLEGLGDSTRPFWKISKVLKNKPRPIPPLKVQDNLLITPVEKADAIGEHLVKSHNLGANIVSPLENRVADCIVHLENADCVVLPERRITLEQICSSVKHLKNMKAPGFDGMFNLVLKKLSNKAYKLLCHVFNKCLELCYFPKDWKLAKIIPILKPGKDPTSSSSYRPISLLPSLSKLFEKLILTRLLAVVEENNIMMPEQFGFRRGHSTSHQLLRLTNTIRSNKAVSKSTAMALLDVEKAFDNVWHDGLVYKLVSLNVPTYLIKIIQNYLSQRHFKVSLNGKNSKEFPIPAGVPQGSLLGPILYNIYTSDIPRLPDGSGIFLFADDTAITVKGRTPNELKNKLQRSLDVFVNYAKSWKIKINESKTQAIMFLHRQSPKLIPSANCKVEIAGAKIDWSPEVLYLGVIYDAKLLFRSHVDKTINKCQTLVKCLYPLINRRSRLSTRNKLTVYKQIILPVIDYAAPVWESCAYTHKRRIQVSQNKTLKMILNLPFDTRTVEVHQQAGVDPIDERIQKHLNKFKSKCDNSEYELVNSLYIL